MKQQQIYLQLLFYFFLGVTLSLASTTAEEKTSSPSSYPLSICVVSGDKLGQMGPPTTINYKGTEVRFCCKDCEKDFQKDPDKYLIRLKQAEEKSK